MSLVLMYITNNPEVALIAEKYGVDRVWIDLETLGKELRQKNFDSVKSHHSIEDIRKIRPILSKAELMVRINPWNSDSAAEINSVIEAGAQRIMLPMWTTPEEVSSFLETVNGRVKTTLLLETIGAEKCLDEVLKISGVDEIHIGLNDLHIQYGYKFMYELVANGTVERICRKISAKRIPYGFGGVARISCGDVPAELVISEHYRLGSSRAILSRSFCDANKVGSVFEIDNLFAEEMMKFREYEERASRFSSKEFEENHKRFIEGVEKVVRLKSGVQS